MVEVITDTKNISISIIQHANCSINNLTYPTEVESGESFDISYDCTNNGATDTCFGKLYDTDTTYDNWEETIPSGGTVNKVVTFNTGITETLEVVLEVGYIK